MDRILDLSSERDAERKAQDALFGCNHHHHHRKNKVSLEPFIVVVMGADVRQLD